MPRTALTPDTPKNAAKTAVQSPPLSNGTGRVSLRPPKIESVRTRLTELAHSLGPGAKMPTVVELRESLGISLTTLHTALGDLEAQGVLMRRHGVGIFVANDLHHKNIALLCDPTFYRVPGLSPFWDMLVEHARQRAAEHEEGFQLHFVQPDSKDGVPISDSLRADFEAGRVDGLLVIGTSQRVMDYLESLTIPMVVFAGPGRYAIILQTDNVVTEGVEVLASQGCRRIARWSPQAAYRTVTYPTTETQPRKIFRETLERFGLTFDPALYEDNFYLIPYPAGETTLSNQEQGYEVARRLFSQPREFWPDGVISTDDMLTRGALTYLERSGIRVGVDFQMVTHANIGSQVLLGYEDVLTLIEVDPAAVVAGMFAQLETLMRGETPSQSHVLLAAKRREHAASPISL
jgi:DNA-binding LacI/PurR family transcriptional regulator